MYATSTLAVALIIRRVLGLAVAILLTAFILWALVSCLRQPEQRYTYVRKPKNFWSGVLAVSLGVVVIQYWVGWRLPFGGLLTCFALFAAVYYLGPERQRMGVDGRRSRGW